MHETQNNGNEGGQEVLRLDRGKWHRPLCTIIVTHHNYSELVGDSLLSILDQTYDNWECIVVDDNSSDLERARLIEIIERLPDHRIRLIENSRSQGQVETFFAGLAQASGEFISPLDPDDRLHPAFLEEMVKAHLNETVFCPIACCDQKYLRLEEGLITGTTKGGIWWKKKLTYPVQIDNKDPDDGALLFFPATDSRWLWTTTSALMVRRSAAKLLVPNRPLGYNSLDSYLAFGAHFLGGTLFLEKPLVYRGLHSRNDYIAETLFSMFQNKARDGAPKRTPQCRRDVVESLFRNGVTQVMAPKRLSRFLRSNFDEKEMALLGAQCPEALEIWRISQEKERTVPSFLRRLWGHGQK
jgi:glycosyltransferase involved in cell wall biosynthesis